MSYLSDIEYQAAREELRLIDELVEEKVLGPERCPEERFLHWPVLNPDRLPAWLKDNYADYGEIRFYLN